MPMQRLRCEGCGVLEGYDHHPGCDRDPDAQLTTVRSLKQEPMVVAALPRWERIVLDFEVLGTWEKVKAL